MAMLKAGKTKDAIAEFQEGVAMTPQNPDMRLALALALLKDGNKRSALAEFRKIVELAPQSDSARTAKDYINTLDPNAAKRSKTK
jgi:Flp pilus assembly protein TadD